jgi:hypothetical protein
MSASEDQQIGAKPVELGAPQVQITTPEQAATFIATTIGDMQSQVVEAIGKPEHQTRVSETSVPGVTVSFYEATPDTPGYVAHKDDWHDEITMMNTDGSYYKVANNGGVTSIVLRASNSGSLIKQGSSEHYEHAPGSIESQQEAFVALAQEFASAFEQRRQNPAEYMPANESARVTEPGPGQSARRGARLSGLLSRLPGSR